ncbi:TPA: type II secretion system minor pseudopilin GspH [Raoultella ornithinolytica]
MRQRGFTLLEMMLILLLMGVSAGMVMLAFPTSREDDAAQTLARFQTQLRFIRERGLQTGQFFGISIHPDRWQFMLLQPRDDAEANPGTEESWYGYRWLPLPPGRVATTGEVASGKLTLSFPHDAQWTPGEQPDVLLFPGGEVTPFQLQIGSAEGIAVDARGTIRSAQQDDGR